ncbi:MAG TPA: succinate dehydrogenase assembly factor 2 [Thiothrix sp.]|nr:succinate dehydrogenase assembly factor 2 [Thiothrix sp.]
MKRLRWQCRRGMLELDTLLHGFLANGYEQLNTQQRDRFQQLLSYPDQALFEMLMGRMQATDAKVQDVIHAIRYSARVRA